MDIYILNTLEHGVDITNQLKNQLKIKGIIGLSSKNDTKNISGFVDVKKNCRKNHFQFVSLDSYNMKNENDKKKLKKLNIDVLLVLGWQRLIPKWLIEKCKFGAIGIHGSPWGINYGRGRSPQNWSLILGKDIFEISIFRINEGIDSGRIIESRKFPLSEFDNIITSYHKSSILISEMIIKNIKKISSNSGHEQKGPTRFLPQRIPDDGQIDWNRKSLEIYNFIRGQTHPYPGAFSFINKTKIWIWHAIPFNLKIDHTEKNPGTIIRVFYNKDLLIKTNNGYILINDYTLKPSKFKLKEGMKMNSINFSKQMKGIVERHYKKFPKNKLNKEILKKIETKN